MKKTIVGMIVALVAGFVVAGDVTQVSSYNLADGKRDIALKTVVNTDLPAIITELNSVNGLTDGTAALSATTGHFSSTLDVHGTLTHSNATVEAGATVTMGSGAKTVGGTVTNASLDHCKDSAGSMVIMGGPSATKQYRTEFGSVTLAANAATGGFTNTYTFVGTYAAAPVCVVAYAAENVMAANGTNLWYAATTTNVLITGNGAVAVGVAVSGRLD